MAELEKLVEDIRDREERSAGRLLDGEQTAQALRESEALLRLAQRCAGAGIWDWDMVTGALQWSDELFHLFGLDPGKNIASFEAWRKAIHPDDLPAAEKNIYAAIEAHTALSNEYRIVLPDGRIRWINALGNTIYDKKNKPERMSGICIDITDRKSTEDALREAERKYRELVQFAPAALYEIDFRNRRFTAVNDAMCEMLGYNREELLSLDPSEITDEEGRKRLQRRIDTWLRGDEPEAETEYNVRSKDGRTLRVLLNVTYTVDDDGNPVGASVVAQDISERKRAEDARRESEERLRLATSAAALGVFEWDVATDKARWENERMYEIFGRTRAEGSLSRAAFYTEVIDPRDRDAFDRTLKEAMNPGRTFDFECRIRRKDDGESRWIKFSARFELSPEGRAIRLIGVIADVTESKQAEEKLKQTERRIRLALRNAPVSVAVQDLDLRYTWAYNQRTVDPELIIGKRDADIFPREEAEMLTAIKRRALEEGVEIREQMWLDRPAGCMYLDVYFEPLRDREGRVIGLGTATVDLTPIKLAEEAAKASRTKLEAALASMTDAVVISDEEGRFLDFNDAFATFHRFKSKEECSRVFDEYPSLLEVFMPDGTPAPVEMWAVPRALRGETVTNAEYELRRRDTGESWVGSYSFSPIRDPHGEIIGSVVVARDVTDLKRAQEQIQSSLAEKEVLLREIHHRVKNNLQVISSLVSLRASGVPDPVLREMFQEVRDRVRAMALVHEKLYETGGLARLDFAAYAESLIRSLHRAHGGASRIRLRFEIEPAALTVGEAVPCGLILNELANNALKHAFPGGEGTLTVSLTRDPETSRIELAVRDDGVGLPEALDPRSVPSFGLRLVQMLADQLGATVEIGPGPGAEFRIGFLSRATESPS